MSTEMLSHHNERLSAASTETQDNYEAHDPALATKFGHIVMEGLGVQAENRIEPFGTKLAEAQSGFHDNPDIDEPALAALGESTYVLKMSTDWL